MGTKLNGSKDGDIDCNGSLFDSSILNESDVGNKGNFLLRSLNVDDFHKGYLNLLSQLTKVGKVDEVSFKKCFDNMKQCKDSYYIIVIEDLDTQQVIASCTLIIEYKFIHSTGLRGRLEDIVVKDSYRGKQFGKILVETVKNLSLKLGVYKLSLDCGDHMIPFYESLDFKLEQEFNLMNCDLRRKVAIDPFTFGLFFFVRTDICRTVFSLDFFKPTPTLSENKGPIVTLPC